MPRRSAGVLLHRVGPDDLEVLLIHPGGPFWRSRDVGAWQIPKGGIEKGEDAEAAARKEAEEELGVAIDVPLMPLGEVRQAGGKLVTAFTAAMDLDAAAIVSGTTEIEWPRGSDRRLTSRRSMRRDGCPWPRRSGSSFPARRRCSTPFPGSSTDPDRAGPAAGVGSA